MPRPKSINKKPVKAQGTGLQTFTCISCANQKKVIDFFKSYNPNYKATGRLPLCKKCFKQFSTDEHGKVNVEKLKNTLKSVDRPFIASLFNAAVEEGGDILGRYMKNISMMQFKDYVWKDSEFEIEQKSIPEEESQTSNLEYNAEWVGKYNKHDLEYLNEYLKSLRKDFKITTRNHIDYAKKIAKASLAMDKAYDDMINNNGSESRYKNLREAFDTLSKSAQFAEVGRGINDVSLGNFGVIFDRVEKHQWIPKHQPTNKDMYDNLLEQFSNINKSL